MSTKGRFVWYDLMTNDAGAAKSFYSEVVGWSTQKWEQGDYEMWVAGETPIGGVMALPDEVKQMGAPPHWLAYAEVDDVDAACERVEKLGGTVHRPGTDIPTVGRFAVIADPEGATLALFQPSGDMPPPKGDQPGQVGWHELNTTDYESAWKFYSELLGWTHQSSFDMGEMGTYFMFKPADGEGAGGGMSNIAKTMNMPPHWLYYFNVDAIEAAAKRVTDNGGKILNGPMEVPGGGWIVQCMDPQGGAFALFAMAK